MAWLVSEAWTGELYIYVAPPCSVVGTWLRSFDLMWSLLAATKAQLAYKNSCVAASRHSSPGHRISQVTEIVATPGRWAGMWAGLDSIARRLLLSNKYPLWLVIWEILVEAVQSQIQGDTCDQPTNQVTFNHILLRIKCEKKSQTETELSVAHCMLSVCIVNHSNIRLYV